MDAHVSYFMIHESGRSGRCCTDGHSFVHQANPTWSQCETPGRVLKA